MQWEYMIIDIVGTNSQDERRLNDLGKDCWELVAVGVVHDDRRLAYLRRPIAELGGRTEQQDVAATAGDAFLP